MTDEAFAGGAPVPAEPSGAPIDTDAVSTPHALGSQIPPKPEPVEPEADKAPKSAGEAIRRANEALKAKEAAKAAEPKEPVKAEAKPEAKPEAKAEPEKVEKPRAEDGKFTPAKPAEQPAQPEQAAKPADPNSPHREAPARFDDGAKADWANAPESVKGAIHRTIRELEQGHQKYKADSEAYEQVREFAERAKQGGTDLPTALRAYVGMEDALRANPIAGLQHIMQNLDLRKADGSLVTLRDVAAHVMGQTPDQVQSQHESTIASLQAEISELKQHLGGVTQTIQQQRMSSVESHVAAFAKDHPRFDELSPDIEFFLKSGRTADLSEAYELAERLNPAPATTSPSGAHTSSISPLAQTQAPAPLNPAGQKSISGAPATGSDPAPRKTGPVPSIRESLNRAKRNLG